MSHSLTDVSTFSSPVVAPDDLDALTAASVSTPLQSLANRTKFLSDAITATPPYGSYTLTGTLVSSGTKFTLTQDAATVLTLASNQVTVPAGNAGLYYLQAQVYGDVFNGAPSSNDPLIIEIAVNGTAIARGLALQYIGAASYYVSAHVSRIILLADNDVVAVRPYSLTANVQTLYGTGGSRLNIARLL